MSLDLLGAPAREQNVGRLEKVKQENLLCSSQEENHQKTDSAHPDLWLWKKKVLCTVKVKKLVISLFLEWHCALQQMIFWKSCRFWLLLYLSSAPRFSNKKLRQRVNIEEIFPWKICVAPIWKENWKVSTVSQAYSPFHSNHDLPILICHSSALNLRSTWLAHRSNY